MRKLAILLILSLFILVGCTSNETKEQPVEITLTPEEVSMFCPEDNYGDICTYGIYQKNKDGSLTFRLTPEDQKQQLSYLSQQATNLNQSLDLENITSITANEDLSEFTIGVTNEVDREALLQAVLPCRFLGELYRIFADNEQKITYKFVDPTGKLIYSEDDSNL